MKGWQWLTRVAVVGLAIALSSAMAVAQTEQRRGVILYNQAQEFREASNALSAGTLAQLRTDPNFAGDIQVIVNSAASILDGYRVVNRRGFFPENRGIPQEAQITRADAVYRVYNLENGNQLFLYRSPSTNTAEYVIRSVQGRP